MLRAVAGLPSGAVGNGSQGQMADGLTTKQILSELFAAHSLARTTAASAVTVCRLLSLSHSMTVALLSRSQTDSNSASLPRARGVASNLAGARLAKKSLRGRGLSWSARASSQRRSR